MMEALSWAANGLAVIGWIVNIKRRKEAMMIFTVATVLSLIYFAATKQLSFVVRLVFYLVIDIVTLWQIHKHQAVGK